jgi:beta-galactosidase
VSANRLPHPGLNEVKKVYQSIQFTSNNIDAFEFEITNRYFFTNLNQFNFSWQLLKDGEVIKEGKIDHFNLEPGKTKTIYLKELKNELIAGHEYFLDLSAKTTDSNGLVPANYELAKEQFTLSGIVPMVSVASKNTISVNEKENNITVKCGNLQVAFDKGSGEMVSLKQKNAEVLKKAPKINFWRAPTDNDYGNQMQRRCQVWKQASQNQKVTSVQIDKKTKGQVSVEITYSLADTVGTAKVKLYHFRQWPNCGETTFEPGKCKLPELPRFGTNLQLSDQYTNVKWYGRGPQENYQDRKTGAFVGIYQSKVADLYFPYIRPQENGYRTDTRWVEFTNKNGHGIRFVADSVICFSAHQNTIDEFDGGMEKTARHTSDIKPHDFISVDIDLNQTGVGGDDSWGRLPYSKYTLYPKMYKYKFFIIEF